ncbi:hypothetical protein [Flavobacterium sp.]|uniref:hypothetical protein n=1 Tax=Flavobacterium sp. TaxID=239 RepID=UPI00286D99C6|nr:hypothetical protein [Flavobacterium sp.]
MKTINIDRQINEINELLTSYVQTIYENKNNDEYYHKLEFNTNQLIDHKNYTKFINNYGELIPIFKDPNEIQENHCLYWFELDNEKVAEDLKKELDAYRIQKLKKVPATNTNDNSNVLYVGIRQGGYTKSKNLTNITGRICQHLGYYENNSTQGLQLYEYARNKNYKITIKVIEFKRFEYSAYLNIFEKLIAEKLKPLCGRH